MAKKKVAEPSVEKHEIRGHLVEIRTVEDKEQLWVDGVRQRFLRSDKGYIIGYIPPQKSLLQAVNNYLDKIPEKK